MTDTMAKRIQELSIWIDSYNREKPATLQLWERCGKLMEESGEVGSALIGLLGQNPRKGVTHSREDLISELSDVAITALGAIEHITGNQGESVEILKAHVRYVHSRALDDWPAPNAQTHTACSGNR